MLNRPRKLGKSLLFRWIEVKAMELIDTDGKSADITLILN